MSCFNTLKQVLMNQYLTFYHIYGVKKIYFVVIVFIMSGSHTIDYTRYVSSWENISFTAYFNILLMLMCIWEIGAKLSKPNVLFFYMCSFWNGILNQTLRIFFNPQVNWSFFKSWYTIMYLNINSYSCFNDIRFINEQ